MSLPVQPLLHVFPQIEQHDAVYIVGNVIGISVLRDLVDVAISRQKIAAVPLHPSDGLRYTCVVACASAEQMQDVPLSYNELPGDRTLPKWVRAASQEDSPAAIFYPGDRASVA